MIVSVHQPNFAPWLGFFDKMLECDVYVLLDTVPFTKRSYQNRVQVKGPNGPQWLTVPVITKGRFAQPTREVKINPTENWRHVHLQTLRATLGRAAHRDALLECVGPLYERDDLDGLVDLNVAFIRDVVARLGIPTRIVMASELGCDGQATRLIANLVKAAGGDVYLSGPTGRDYLEPDLLAREGVALQYHEFRPFEYPQLFGDFAPGLSCMDYIANVGYELWRAPRAVSR